MGQQSSAICYIEIPAPNLDRTGEFYSAVFGWKVTPSNLSDKPYWMFQTGEGQLEGGFDPSRSVKTDGGVILYLKVNNIDQALTDVSNAGGKIARAKFEIGGGYGYSALINDPNGNEIGLLCEK